MFAFWQIAVANAYENWSDVRDAKVSEIMKNFGGLKYEFRTLYRNGYKIQHKVFRHRSQADCARH
jgi:hypothetical protein